MMKIKIFDNNDMGQNIYLYYNDTNKEGVLIDTGCSTADMAALSDYLNKNNINIKAILLTHGHYDHIIAAIEIKNLTKSEI